MVIVGYILGILVGMVLGLFGSGGAIISFPVLIYFLDIEPQYAGIYSLIIVGIAALTGILKNIKTNSIDFKVAIIFSVPLLLSFYITRYFILPQIPFVILPLQNFDFTKNHLIMLLFISTMSYIIFGMLTSKNTGDKVNSNDTPFKFNLRYVLHSGLVGILAATIGAGGGFVIVPALMNIFHLPIKKATSTSLMIITINAFAGTLLNLKDFSNQHLIIVGIFAVMAIIGIFIGTYLNKILSSQTLKKSYAYFLLIVLISTISSEIYKTINQ